MGSIAHPTGRMMDWDDLRVFLAVARTESLSAAGKRLKIDPATVGRRIGRLEEVSDDRARDHQAAAGRHALQRAKGHQRADGGTHGAADGSQREDRHRCQHHRAAAETVGQRTVEQVHHGKAEEIRRQRLLHLHRCGADLCRDARERRQVGIDRERPEHAEAREQQRQRPTRALPQGLGVRVHVLSCSS